MPDASLPDTTVLTAAFWSPYVREQLVTTCTSGTRPTGVEGRLIYETDTNRYLFYDGSNWKIYSAPPTSFTPTWTNLTASASTAHYWYAGGHLNFGLRSTVSTVTGTVSLLLPNSATTTGYAVGVCRYLDTGTRSFVGACEVDSGATGITFYHPDATSNGAVTATAPFTWAAGDFIYVSMTAPVL